MYLHYTVYLQVNVYRISLQQTGADERKNRQIRSGQSKVRYHHALSPAVKPDHRHATRQLPYRPFGENRVSGLETYRL